MGLDLFRGSIGLDNAIRLNSYIIFIRNSQGWVAQTLAKYSTTKVSHLIARLTRNEQKMHRIRFSPKFLNIEIHLNKTRQTELSLHLCGQADSRLNQQKNSLF